MIGRARIQALVPHGGAMCLLDEVLAWDAAGIACRTRSHLDPSNPLRAAGRLGAVCGLEYALQAAALHGALTGDGRPQPAGAVAALREVAVTVSRLDDPALGTLRVEARLERRDAVTLVYALALASEAGARLLGGRATIVLPRPGADAASGPPAPARDRPA